jgi:purine-nucleoside phosphorylase
MLRLTSTMLEQIQEAARFIQANTSVQPSIGIILGTGLGALAGELTIETTLNYEMIPHFPLSTVEFHSGKLFLGTLEGKPVVVMQGRFHYYEGYSMQQVTFPVRVMHALGVRTLLVSNAAGGMNPDFQTTDLMVIEDHIGLLLPQNPLVGPNPPEFGDRFPDMSEPYSKALIEQAFRVASERGISLKKGVYVSVTGPQLETRAEYRMLRQWGADAVGMSTVPEVIVANQMGMAVFGVSVITDMCLPDTLEKADISKIIAAAGAAEPKLTELMRGLVSVLGA